MRARARDPRQIAVYMYVNPSIMVISGYGEAFLLGPACRRMNFPYCQWRQRAVPWVGMSDGVMMEEDHARLTKYSLGLIRFAGYRIDVGSVMDLYVNDDLAER